MAIFDELNNQWFSAQNASSATSLDRVTKTSRTQKKQIQEAQPGEVGTSQSVIPTTGYADPPTQRAAEPKERAADYYRYGSAQVRTQGGIIQTAGGDLIDENLQPAGFSYDLFPKILDEFKEEEASIRLVGKKSGTNEDIDLIPPWTKFILQSASESYNERAQIVETFGDYFVFFFGQRPITYNFSGTLINAKNASWLNDWKFMYQNFLRGTKAIENNARIIMTYGGRQIEGFLLSTSNQTDATLEMGVPFNFQIIVTDEKFLNFSNDFGIIVFNGDLVESNSFIQLLTESGLSQPDINNALQQAKEVLDKQKKASETEKATAINQSSLESNFGVNLEQTVTGGLRRVVV